MKQEWKLSDIQTLRIRFGHYYGYETFCFSGKEDVDIEGIDNVLKKFTELRSPDGDDIELNIRIIDGKVLNWPIGYSLDLHNWKIVDEGYYALLDADNNVIMEYYGYVPDCIGEYGDYYEFSINEDGYLDTFYFGDGDLIKFEKSVEKSRN